MSTDAVLSTPLIISFGLCGRGSLVFETVRPRVPIPARPHAHGRCRYIALQTVCQAGRPKDLAQIALQHRATANTLLLNQSTGGVGVTDAPDSHADLLSRPLFAHLATVRPDGAPLVNPMWFLWDEARGVVKLTHTKRRSNYNFFQSEPRVAMDISDPDDPYRYLQIRGVVEAIEDDPTGAFYKVLQLRYRGTVGEVSDREYRVIVTIRPTGFKVR